MSSGPLTATVIIPHYNDVDRLARCLAALVPQSEGRDGVDILVCDNGSTEDLSPIKSAHPSVQFVTETEKGAGPARNRGVMESEGTWLFFLDADCVPAADWLASALTAAQTTTADIIGGRVDTFDETPGAKSGAEAYETVWAFQQRHYIENRGFSVTANMLTRRAVFDSVGPFINGLPEDIDWCRRARKAGHRLSYNDTLRVAHPTRQDWPALKRKLRRLTAERFALDGSNRAKWALRALLVFAQAIKQAPQALIHPDLTIQERFSALGTLARACGLRAYWMLRQAAGRSI